MARPGGIGTNLALATLVCAVNLRRSKTFVCSAAAAVELGGKMIKNVSSGKTGVPGEFFKTFWERDRGKERPPENCAPFLWVNEYHSSHITSRQGYALQHETSTNQKRGRQEDTWPRTNSHVNALKERLLIA